MPAAPAPEKEILRSVIDFGSDGQEIPLVNLKKLVSANLVWTDPALADIFGYVKSYYVEHEAAPTDDIIRAHFEGLTSSAATTAVETLGDIEVARAWSTTNFDETLTSAVRFQQNVRLQSLMKVAAENFKKHSLENNNNAVLTIIQELNDALATSSDDAATPTIQLGPKIHLTTQACVEALKADLDLYARGRHLVSIVPPDEAGGTSTIEPVPVSVLTNVHLSRVANFEHQVKRGWAPTKPTRDLGQTLCELKVWPGLRFLRGVTNVPLMRPDGSILSEPGYDAATRLLVDPRVEVLPIPEAPSLEDARRALALLTDLLHDFPIVASGRSTWLAGLFTFFGREMFEGPTPAMIFDSNNPGTGKGLLTHIMGLICMGESVPAYTFIDDEVELRKRVTSILIQGKGLVLIDNVPTTAKFGVGPTWNSLLTATTFADRELGASKSLDLPNRSVWLVTGVNVDVAGDCTRRFITCRMETDLEHPEERDPSSYMHPDLVGYVREHRPELIQAVLTILRAWVVAGRLEPSISLGSYETWSQTICACIEWLGLPSPIVTRTEYADRRGNTGDSGTLAPLLRELEAFWGLGKENSHTISELLKSIQNSEPPKISSEPGMDVEDSSSSDRVVIPNYEALREALLEFCPTRGSGLPSTKSLGKRFSAALTRPADGLRLDGAKDRLGTFRWWVCRVCRVSAGFDISVNPAPMEAELTQDSANAGFAGFDSDILTRSKILGVNNSPTLSAHTTEICNRGEGGKSNPANPANSKNAENTASDDAGFSQKSNPAETQQQTQQGLQSTPLGKLWRCNTSRGVFSAAVQIDGNGRVYHRVPLDDPALPSIMDAYGVPPLEEDDFFEPENPPLVAVTLGEPNELGQVPVMSVERAA